MNKGPMSRLVKVPVKCRTCGKIKYNVVCENQAEEKPKEIKKAEEPKEQEKIVSKEKKYKKPKEYSYINAVVNKQRQIARSAYSKDSEK